jgi:hypothetical protein
MDLATQRVQLSLAGRLLTIQPLLQCDKVLREALDPNVLLRLACGTLCISRRPGTAVSMYESTIQRLLFFVALANDNHSLDITLLLELPAYKQWDIV